MCMLVWSVLRVYVAGALSLNEGKKVCLVSLAKKNKIEQFIS
jgi:hypothetical protein